MNSVIVRSISLRDNIDIDSFDTETKSNVLRQDESVALHLGGSPWPWRSA